MTTDARALLDAWKARGLNRVDPLRFNMLAAFARRAAAHDGDARRLLDDRLATLLAAYAAEVADVADVADSADVGRATHADAADTTRPPAQSPLAALNDYLVAHSAPSNRASWPELDMLDYFRQTWSRISIDAQWRQSRDQVPTNAGPLNSSSLVHRALSLMRAQSPGYLQHFLSYVDALSWMDQMSGGEAPKETRRASATKKSPRSRAR